MSSSLAQIKSTFNTLLPSGSATVLSLSEANLGLVGLELFLKETINLKTLDLKQARLAQPEQPDKVEVSGTASLLGQTDVTVTFRITATSDKGPLRTSIHFPWPSTQPLPFGNYQLQKPQFELTWMGSDASGAPMLYGLISGNMQLGSLLAPMQIRFPAAPDSIFIQSMLENPVTLGQGLQQLAGIVPEAKELSTFLPADVAKAISSLALDEVGILYNTKKKQLNLISFSVSAAGWTLFNNFSIEDLRFSLSVGGIGSGNTTLTAELDASLVIEKSYRLPLFIRIAPSSLSIGKQSTERFQLPSFAKILDAIGEKDIANSMPDSFKAAAITVDTLEISFDTAAKKLSSVYFAVSIDNLHLEDNFELKFLGLGFRMDKQGSSYNISGNFMCALLLGKTNPVELDVSAALTTGPGGAKSWSFNARAENINVGGLIDTIAEAFDADVSLPTQLHELVITELGLSFSKAVQSGNSQSDYTFTCEIKYPRNGQKADISLTILLTQDQSRIQPTAAQQQVQQPKSAGGYFVAISGKIIVDGKEFDLGLNVKKGLTDTSELLLLEAKNVSIGLSDLAGSLIDDPSIQSLIPSVTIKPNYALIARLNKNTATPPYPKNLLGLSLGLDISLKGLPLVGKLLGSADFQAKDIQFTYASANLNEADVQAVNSLNPPAPLPLQPPSGMSTAPPAADGAAPIAATAIVLAQGLGFKAAILLGPLPPLQINIPAGPRQSSPAGKQPQQLGARTGVAGGAPGLGSSTAASPPATSATDATWIDIQQAVGPVQFNRIGFKYKDKMIWGYLDASLTLAGLTLSLDGLGFGNPLDSFDPHFSLNGLGLDYSQGPVEIGGSFLRTTVTDSNGTYDEYDGMAIIKAEILTISAIGSYAKVNGHDSLFIFAVVDYPIGGPPFFFVTGLAAGFGYNRAVRIPPITGVATFPLVDEAVNGAGSGPPADPKGRREYLQQELTRLRYAIYPKKGEYFLAAGIRFSTFEMIDSFAMVSVSFGQHFELDILGLSTLVIPTPQETQAVSPIAEAQLALRAVFNPDIGVLSIEAQLTNNSYVFSRSCHLTGGFAFYAWFGGPHKGDFVITLGGYHPRFIAPSYYPKVPRLGINWPISNLLFIKGELYFALTAHALMAGGMLEALFHLGPIRAWFIIGADFIISWKPYFYDARLYIDIGASFTFWLFGTHTITFELGANLHIWGPDFSGKATIHYYIVSFTISFGHSSDKPRPLQWEEFRSAFLPDDSKICTLTVTGGLVKEEDEAGSNGRKRAILNPRSAALVVNSMVPVKTYELHLNEGPASTNKEQLYFADSGHEIILPISDEARALNAIPTSTFGIAPMAVAEVAKSDMVITINKKGEAKNPVNSDFAFTPVLKRMPCAMWGEQLLAEVNGQQFIENALAGFEIRPATPAKPGVTHRVVKKALQYEISQQTDAFSCPGIQSYTFSGKGAPDLSQIAARESQRNGLLQSLGLQPGALGLEIPPDVETIFVEKPLAGTFA
ncbi:MAG: hypothetical protein H6564_15060 [Lewinellaceae bacterium]|nr:hypothetical protein [Lewinellaceae bacterium]